MTQHWTQTRRPPRKMLRRAARMALRRRLGRELVAKLEALARIGGDVVHPDDREPDFDVDAVDWTAWR